MVWDITQPTDTTKIRNLGVVIRPNWQAIEQGGSTFKPIALNFNNRTPLPDPNDPAAIAEAYILYCKDDSAGDPQLFGIDAASVVTQFTGGAPLLGNSGHVFLAGGILLQWFRATAADSATITFPIPFSAIPYVIVGNETSNNLTDRDFVKPADSTYTAADFVIRLVRIDGNAQAVAKNMQFIAIGPA